MKVFLGFLLVYLAFAQNVFSQIEDQVFRDHIQSVRIFPQGIEFDSQIDAPTISLRDSRSLVLLFDDIAFDPELYTAKLIHCDADWKPSQLKDNDFLSGFNQFNVQDYEYSVNTRLPYIHYRFEIPRVTKSGNYVVKVYRGREESDAILTKRFMVYEDLFSVGASIVPPSQTSDRRTDQQIDVVVNYSKVEVVNPSSQIKVVIRQNQRWDHAKLINEPTFLNEISKTIRYENFDGTNSFRAGNEFRFIDLRFIRATGANIASVTVESDVIYAETKVDVPREWEVYSQYLDLNGQYIVYTNDRPGGNPEVESEYILTTFRFFAPESSREIYLLGTLTDWGKKPEAKMSWNPKLKVYETTLLLKQGWYDYQFARLEDQQFDSMEFEGSYFETENEYEVLVYFRALGSRYDQLVGYVYLQPNRRRL
ncbi:DUF5103 domain-containing protein [Algoriphagus limi]|uniref:DUF5103 domain-containing protein n=1 Tax=Algoriphagus limi TaxID=2975273 RepID=A0ABT2G1F9_9BACT|nr:DUF5103 domain-containing protein [Algoriphagus limi]MCS5489108.1 DUF5103 domain-containing protein [Algoriphagus limi]